jgi:hypothetical protein
LLARETAIGLPRVCARGPERFLLLERVTLWALHFDSWGVEEMSVTAAALVGRSPGSSIGAVAGTAALRALRTFLQGVVASFGTGAAGTAIITADYWKLVGISIVGAAITALASFIQNVSLALPEDPTQKKASAG